MNPLLHWSLQPLPTVANVFHHVLDNISKRLIEISNSTEPEVTIYTIKLLIENAIAILRGASTSEILAHFSILNSVIVCTLKHLFLNSYHLDLHSSPQFHHCCHQIDRLRQHYFKVLLGDDNKSCTLVRIAPIIRDSLMTLRQPKQSDPISVQALVGAILLDPLQFPLKDLLSILYHRKPSDLIVANLVVHLPIFANLSFIKPTVHIWGADAITKRLHKYGLFSSALHWICRPLYIIYFLIGNNRDDSLLPYALHKCDNKNTSYLDYLQFTCNWDVQSLPISLPAPCLTSTPLDKIVYMFTEYSVLEEPDEYILMCELITSGGMQAYALLFGLSQEGPTQHPVADPHEIQKLITQLRSALSENCKGTMEPVCVQSLMEHLISASTKPMSQLKSPIITLICFSLVTCYFSLSMLNAVESFFLSYDPNLTTVKAIFQFEALILVSLHKCLLDALCNFKEQGRWLELYPITFRCSHYMHVHKGAKASIHKILEMPLSSPIIEAFKAMANPSTKQTKLKTAKGRSRTPFLCTRECKFVVVFQGIERELSVFELLVWDLRHLELSQLINYIQNLWNYSWIEAENKLRIAMNELHNAFYPRTINRELKVEDRQPDNIDVALYPIHTPRITNQNQIELIVRCKLVQIMKHIGSIQLTDISQIKKYVNEINSDETIFHLESDTIKRLIAWGVENGYFEISGHNPQMLCYIE